MVTLSSDLSNVRKSWTDEEEAKRTAEETIQRERQENEDKVSNARLCWCFLVVLTVFPTDSCNLP